MELKAKKILIVEDDKNIAEIIDYNLQKNGAKFSNCAEAIHLLTDNEQIPDHLRERQ